MKNRNALALFVGWLAFAASPASAQTLPTAAPDSETVTLSPFTTYTLPKEGWLKGWSVGGNFRWRSANTVGFERALVAGVPSGVIDPHRPIKGGDFWDVGAMLAHERRIFRNVTLRTQLNVENLFGWSKARLVSSDYDTEGVVGAANTLVPIRWELRRPRNFILTATFGF